MHLRSSALLEVRQRRARAQHDAGQVDGDELVPVVERGILDALADEDAGIVHQHVELAELLDRGVHRVGPARLLVTSRCDVDRRRRLDLLGQSCGRARRARRRSPPWRRRSPSASPSLRRCRAPRRTETRPCRPACSFRFLLGSLVAPILFAAMVGQVRTRQGNIGRAGHGMRRGSADRDGCRCWRSACSRSGNRCCCR